MDLELRPDLSRWKRPAGVRGRDLGLDGVSFGFIRPAEEVGHTDLILIPSLREPLGASLAGLDRAAAWLEKHYRRGAMIGAMCTGVFLLAATGLLDGRPATTNWRFEKVFRRRHPKVNLLSERIFTEEGRLFCCGSGTAAYDLCLRLVSVLAGQNAGRPRGQGSAGRSEPGQPGPVCDI